MSGTLTITSPAVDNEAGHDSSFLQVAWSFAGNGSATQIQRRVTVQRTGSDALLADTGMQASTATTFTVSNLNSGIYYTVTVSVLDTSGSTTSTSRIVVARYSRSLPPVLQVAQVANGLAVTISNPSSGDRPTVTATQVYRRAAGSTGPWSLVTTLFPNGTFVDREVRSGGAYEYFGRGFSNPGAAAATGVVVGDGTLSAKLGTPSGAAQVDNAVVDLSTVGG